MPWDAIASGIGTIASIINTAQVNKTNMKMQRETNAANREMVQMQNDAAAAESQKAYERSKATNQVNLMTSAGMSRAGAINAISGGGSYTPAPVNTSQDSAPQMQTTDFSGLSNLAQIALQNKQLKQQERIRDRELSIQQEENALNRQNAKEIAEINAESSRYSADSSRESSRYSAVMSFNAAMERLGFERYKFDYLAPYQKEQLLASTNKIIADTELTQAQKQDLVYKVKEYQSIENKTMRDTESLLRTIAADYNYHIQMADFEEYRKQNYTPVYDNGEIVAYLPRVHNEGQAAVMNAANKFWEFVGTIVPVEYLAKVVKIMLGK